MPNLFPALLGATALCISVSQFNLAHAQTIITNGTTVGQQILGPGQSILIEQGGQITENDVSSVLGMGGSLFVNNSGSLDTTLQNVLTGKSVDLAGNLNQVTNSGLISTTVELSVAGTSSILPPLPIVGFAGIASVGDRGIFTNTGQIITNIEGSTVPVAGCQSGQCVGTAASDVTNSVHGIAISGNENSIENHGVITTIMGRATHSQSSAVLVDGDNNIFENNGILSLQKLDGSAFIQPDLRNFPSGDTWSPTISLGDTFLSLANFYQDAALVVRGSNNLIINNGLIELNLPNANRAVAINAYWEVQDANTIINNGEILSDSAGILARNSEIINRGNIVGGSVAMDRFTATSVGVSIFNSTLLNLGSISGQGEGVAVQTHEQAGQSDPFPNFAHQSSSVTNFGQISGATSSGILAQDGTELSLNNFGEIRGPTGILFGGGSPATFGTVNVQNYGSVIGTFAGMDISSRASFFGIGNTGSISGSRFGIINDTTLDELIISNSGEILGETAIYSEKSLILDNMGRVYTTGIADQNYAIFLSPPDNVLAPDTTLADPNDDEITFRAGTRIIGRMYMGAASFLSPTLSNGNDTITLDRTSPDIAWRWTFDNFDLPGQDPFDAGGIDDSLFILGNNVPYYIWNGPVTGDYGPFPSEGGITVYIPNISGIFAANGIMEDIARTVHGGIRNRLNEGWDHENLPQNLFYRSEDDIVLRDGSDLAGAPLEALDPAVFRKAPPLTVWAKGFGGIRNEAGTANYGDYSHLWTGGIAGLDLRSSQGDENDDGLRDTEDDDHWNIGVLGGYVQSDLSFASGFKDIQSDFFFAGAYGRLVRDALYLDASVIGGFGGMSEYGPIANNLVPGGIENPGEGYSTDGRFISPSASIGKRFYITDTISFTPEVNATYLAQWIDGSTSPLTLSIEDRFIDTVFGHVQGSVKKVIKRDNSTIIGELRGGLYMSRQLHGDETNLSVVTNQFTIDTSREDIVSPYVGLGATWEIADNFKLSADGEMDFGDLDGGRARFGASLSF